MTYVEMSLYECGRWLLMHDIGWLPYVDDVVWIVVVVVVGC